MNKDELLNLKDFFDKVPLENVVIYTKDGEIISDEVRYSMRDFVSHFNKDAKDVVDVVMSIFDRMIRYCAIHGDISYEKLIINPSFGLLVDGNCYDMERKKVNEYGLFYDVVFVDFYKMFYVDDEERKVELDSEKILGKDNGKNYLVLFSDFLSALNNVGLDFDKFVDFYNLVFDSTSLEIIVDFKKRVRVLK